MLSKSTRVSFSKAVVTGLIGALFLLNFGTTSATGGLSELTPLLENDFVGKSLVDFFNQRTHADEPPLVDEDEAFSPNLDPRGRPSLPSSCLAAARPGSVSRSDRPASGSGSNRVAGKAGIGKNVGPSEYGNSTSPQDENKDSDLAAQREKITRDHMQRMNAAREKYQLRIAEISQEHQTDVIKATQNLTRDTASSDGDAVEVRRASEVYSSRMAEIEREKTRLTNSASQRLATSISESTSTFDREFSAATAEFSEGLNPVSEKNEAVGPKQREENDIGASAELAKEAGGEGTSSSTLTRAEGNAVAERDKDAGCRCLADAYTRLEKRQYSLEKLLIIGQHTKKVLDYAISFGDDVSGMHAVSGLAWQSERAGILKSKKSFDNTYNNKYKELTDKLYTVLQEIDLCERKMGVENWYSNSGFIYFEFMKARYASYE